VAIEEDEVIAAASHPMTGREREAERLRPVEVQRPRALYREVLPGVIQAPADFLLAMARKSSIWPMTFGLACCAIEMMSAYMSHHDLDRFGIVPWASPRQADVMIVAGTVTKKMGPSVKLLYEQMPNPKWVLAMGSCATNGGPYTRYDRVVQGVDKLIPVDVYVPGCPPRPEALIEGLVCLQEKIMRDRGSIG
jgi:NADH-quinone oxidoreductase subunit B